MLHWKERCHHCRAERTGLHCACFKTYSESKTFQHGFLADVHPNSERRTESLEKQQVEPGLIDLSHSFSIMQYMMLAVLAPHSPPEQGAESWHADAALRELAWFRKGCGTAEGQLPAEP